MPLPLKNICFLFHSIWQVSHRSSHLAFTRTAFYFNCLTVRLEYQYIVQILAFARQSIHEKREVFRNNFLILITLRKQLTSRTPVQHLFHTYMYKPSRTYKMTDIFQRVVYKPKPEFIHCKESISEALLWFQRRLWIRARLWNYSCYQMLFVCFCALIAINN